MEEQEDFYARFNGNYRDVNNRRIQLLEMMDTATNKPSRIHYLTMDEAIEAINDEFQFEEGRQYLIKLNTADGWKQKGTGIFTYHDGMDLNNEIYNDRWEANEYGYDALDKDQIHVFGIAVEDRT